MNAFKIPVAERQHVCDDFARRAGPHQTARLFFVSLSSCNQSTDAQKNGPETASDAAHRSAGLWRHHKFGVTARFATRVETGFAFAFIASSVGTRLEEVDRREFELYLGVLQAFSSLVAVLQRFCDDLCGMAGSRV